MRKLLNNVGAFRVALVAGLVFSSTLVFAADAVQVITQKLKQNLPRAQIESVTQSQLPSLYEVALTTGEIIHVSADGNYIVNGDLLAVSSEGLTNVTEERRSKDRIKTLATLKDKDLVVFESKGEEKGELLVFTDTSCGYCQKFHGEVTALNDLGVTVKYVAWPRQGVTSPTGKTMANIWCADDKQQAMTAAKSRQSVAEANETCNSVPTIQAQVNLGRKLGVNGTPAIYLNDGRKVGGYRTAVDLAKELGI